MNNGQGIIVQHLRRHEQSVCLRKHHRHVCLGTRVQFGNRSSGEALTRAYGGTIAFEHGWNAEWRTSLFGGAQVLDYNAAANAIMCGKFGVGAAAGGGGAAASATTGTLTTTGCNFDYRVVGAGTRTYWMPICELTIGVEVQWSDHHVSHTPGSVYNQPSIVGFKPNASYEVRDQNVFSGIFSVRRYF